MIVGESCTSTSQSIRRRHGQPDSSWRRVGQTMPRVSSSVFQAQQTANDDRDAIYGETFRRQVTALKFQEVPTAPRSPWQNAYAERVIGSTEGALRRECLNHMIVLGERHLRRILRAAAVLDPGRGKTKTGYLWALARDERPLGRSGPARRGVLLRARSRRGSCRAFSLRVLLLQVDGYAGYKRGGRARQGGDSLLGAREAQAVRDPRQPPLGGRRAGIAPDRGRCTPSRSRSGGEPAEVRPGRSPGAHRAAGQGVRGLAEAATRPRLTEVAPGREAGLHRQSLGRATGVPHRWPRGDGFKRGGKHDPPAGSESQGMRCSPATTRGRRPGPA